jgi:hypothetical protein
MSETAGRAAPIAFGRRFYFHCGMLADAFRVELAST